MATGATHGRRQELLSSAEVCSALNLRRHALEYLVGDLRPRPHLLAGRRFFGPEHLKQLRERLAERRRKRA